MITHAAYILKWIEDVEDEVATNTSSDGNELIEVDTVVLVRLEQRLAQLIDLE